VYLLLVSVTQDVAPGTLITGIIRDRQTNQALAGARVVFSGTAFGSVFTDGAGRYTFTASDLMSFGGGISGGLYAAAAGYFEAPPVFVADLGTQPALPVVEDISRRPGGPVIVGTVRDATTGQGIAGAGSH